MALSEGIEPIRIFVPGLPPRKDSWYATIIKRGKAIRILSQDAARWQDALHRVWARQRRPTIRTGPWQIVLRIDANRLRHLDMDFPYRDIDSALSPVLDSLQRAGVIDDDMRLCAVSLRRGYSLEPGTTIDLMPWPGEVL